MVHTLTRNRGGRRTRVYFAAEGVRGLTKVSGEWPRCLEQKRGLELSHTQTIV